MNIEEMIVLSPWHRTWGGSARHIIDAHLSLYRLGAVKVERQIIIKLLFSKAHQLDPTKNPGPLDVSAVEVNQCNMIIDLGY